ncbi:MAG: hypothetical protein IJT87_02495 [Ruminiclostridium sp.]|nr:hypothetical protein [Ruminiclostridium sp.]
MQLTQKMLKRVDIFGNSAARSGYVGRKRAPVRLGFVYAEVFPEKDRLSDERGGERTSGGATLILRANAGVKCGDLAGIYGEVPDSRIVEVERFPSHITVRTERI